MRIQIAIFMRKSTELILLKKCYTMQVLKIASVIGKPAKLLLLK